MSIVGMADARIQRKRIDRGATPLVVAADAPRTITPLKAATDVARYVPTEAIGLYIAILTGAFGALRLPPNKRLDQLDYSSRWHFYLIMLAVTAGLVWLIYAAKTRAHDRRRRDVPVFEMAVAVIAMAAWAAALPDTPFADFHWYGGWFAGIALATTTAVLPLIAAAFGRDAPAYTEAPSGPGGEPAGNVK
jgi:cytochrome bd-type quinol oxidase subunit 2